jgi:hypothetical protein
MAYPTAIGEEHPKPLLTCSRPNYYVLALRASGGTIMKRAKRKNTLQIQTSRL